MSHAWGKITVDGKAVAYYEYNGIVDLAISHLYRTLKEVNENWRHQSWLDCTCGNPPIDCLIYTDYGAGFHWPGKVCLTCMAIVEGTDPYTDDGPDPIRGDPTIASLTQN